ncbi:hypothetical protein FO519_005706 [Halicephalobus sp. NKZ332]|nr:hypothetical protein FO519_005706 [Halicephalobus sp. NKZ332]
MNSRFRFIKEKADLDKLREFEKSEQNQRNRRLLLRQLAGSLNKKVIEKMNAGIILHDHDLRRLALSIKCEVMFQGAEVGQPYFESLNRSIFWRFRDNEESVFREIENSDDKCGKIKEFYPFLEKPLSMEEAEYPIGYGMLVHSGLEQIMYELSTFYQPQNAYCIAVDGNSTKDFLRRMKMLEACFPNIHVFQSAPIEYCGFEIINTLWKCVEKLTFSNHPWKYFQYISGVDLPLKTNREMVRILKALNGSFNIDIMKIEEYRLPANPSPLEMWKSSMSALFSRESANFMVRNVDIHFYLQNLRSGVCQDESLWGTIAGQPDVIPMPGGFNGTELFKKVFDQVPKMERLGKIKKKPTENEPFPLKSYYISRYQVWDRIDLLNTGTVCKGTLQYV